MPRLRSLIPNLCSEATRRIRDFDLGLIGTMLLQLFKVGNITLQLLILEPYHQISGLSTLDPPAGYTPLVFFHLGLFYPSTVSHVALPLPSLALQTSLRLPPYCTSRRQEDLGLPPPAARQGAAGPPPGSPGRSAAAPPPQQQYGSYR